jgi:hypothetical protein
MESSLQKLVQTESNGKLDFSVKKVRFHIFDLRFDFKESEIHTIDSINAESGYRVKIDRLLVDVHSLSSVFIRNLFIIDSVIIQSPTVEVIKYKKSEQAKISISGEMGKVYKSLEKGLSVVNLNYLRIADAKFIIDDQSNPGIHLSFQTLTLPSKIYRRKVKLQKTVFCLPIVLCLRHLTRIY